MQLRNRTFVVTGGADGVGRELVLQLLSKGARVAAVDINEDALQELAGIVQDPSALSVHLADISDSDRVAELPEEIIAGHGCIDGLINNAGIMQPFHLLRDMESGTIERVMKVNFFGTLSMTRRFLPYLLHRPEAHLTFISSMGGFLPVPGQSIYGASKAAIKLLGESLSLELCDTPVRTMVVFPGGINSKIFLNSGVEFSPEMQEMSKKAKMLSTREAAEAILKGIEKDRVRLFVGSDSIVMDLLYRIVPRTAMSIINEKLKGNLKSGTSAATGNKAG